MSELNSERVLVDVARRWGAKAGVRVELLGDGWVLRLSRGDRVRYVHGYTFDLNGAGTAGVLRDKAAASEAMARAGVAAVEHRFVPHPDLAKFMPEVGGLEAARAGFEAFGCDVVVKDNAGTGGRGVTRARTVAELEAAAGGCFARGQSAALCRFLSIERETRLIMLDGACVLAYSKERLTVRGDGERAVRSLVEARAEAEGPSGPAARCLANADEGTTAAWARVPAKGEVVLVNWRHNLGQGADVRFEDAASGAMAGRLALAMSAVAALNLTFGSVDVVRVAGREMVLEVNAGVMVDAVAKSPGGPAIAKRVYEQALSRMFE